MSKQIANDLSFVLQPIRESWFCGILIVLGTNTIGLVDTGLEQTPRERVFLAVKHLGRRLDDVQYVVNS